MPSAEVITKWAAGIFGGLLLALQGINLKEVTDVSHEHNAEMTLISRVHEELEVAIQNQKEMIDWLKKHP